MKKKILTSIDLFSGAGGLTQGFKKYKFKSLFGNDHEKIALKTFAHNHPEAITSSQSIESLAPAEIRRHFNLAQGELDVLLGGPPCQGFSTYGKRDPQDHRNRLYQYFLKFLEEFRPKVFVIENVVGILSIEQGNIVDSIVTRVSQLGYSVSIATLDAVEFGVPQFRKRVFIFGGAEQQKLNEPSPTHSLKSQKVHLVKSAPHQLVLPLQDFFDRLKPAITVGEAIADLPKEVLPPRLTHETMTYSPVNYLTPYQHEMRCGVDELLHHSAKQMLGIRRLRLALMRPGDYGTKIRSRLIDGGLPNELIEDLLSGGAGFRNLSECRREDREKEEKLRKILQQGHVDIEEILKSLDSGGFANKYRRLNWDTPSHTLVAHMARDCSDFIHPEIDRFISVREAARLQSFPDNYYFYGSQFQQFRQIGNAVPPKLAEAIALEVLRVLRGNTQAIVATRN
jgi:DNA (cytosine-5)-methyltransferase 1